MVSSKIIKENNFYLNSYLLPICIYYLSMEHKLSDNIYEMSFKQNLTKFTKHKIFFENLLLWR